MKIIKSVCRSKRDLIYESYKMQILREKNLLLKVLWRFKKKITWWFKSTILSLIMKADKIEISTYFKAYKNCCEIFYKCTLLGLSALSLRIRMGASANSITNSTLNKENLQKSLKLHTYIIVEMYNCTLIILPFYIFCTALFF